MKQAEQLWPPFTSISSRPKKWRSPVKSIKSTFPGSKAISACWPGHAPVVAAVRPGILTITTGGAHQKIIVLGGLAEMSENGLTVLADVAPSTADIDRGVELLDVAAVHHRDAVAHRQGLFLVVRDEDERDAERPLNALQFELHLPAKFLVEGAEWFIEQ